MFSNILIISYYNLFFMEMFFNLISIKFKFAFTLLLLKKVTFPKFTLVNIDIKIYIWLNLSNVDIWYWLFYFIYYNFPCYKSYYRETFLLTTFLITEVRTISLCAFPFITSIASIFFWNFIGKTFFSNILGYIFIQISFEILLEVF